MTRLQRLAERIGCTEGQLYTMVISLVVAGLLVAFGGVPLRSAPSSDPAPSPSPSVSPTASR